MHSMFYWLAIFDFNPILIELKMYVYLEFSLNNADSLFFNCPLEEFAFEHGVIALLTALMVGFYSIAESILRRD